MSKIKKKKTFAFLAGGGIVAHLTHLAVHVIFPLSMMHEVVVVAGIAVYFVVAKCVGFFPTT